MDGPRLRAAFAVLLIALAAALVVASPVLDRVRGLSVDILTALRWRTYGNAYPPESSAVVVVALDEETFRTPPFEGTPSVTWTPEIGQVLTALIDGGASVVGFDLVFSTSIEQSAAPFGAETLGARVRGFDREYLRALAFGGARRQGGAWPGSAPRTSAAAFARATSRGRLRPQHSSA